MSESARKAKVITVINLKGGVGKTHTVWMFAAVCERRGKHILAVDLDTQANLTNSFTPGPSNKPGVDVLFAPAGDTIPHYVDQATAFASISLVPAGPRLSRFDVSDQAEWERSELHLALVEPTDRWRCRYDYVVFDCPPRLSVVSFAALCASDYVIIPLEAADWGAQGILQVTTAIEYVQGRHNRDLHLLGYLVSRFKRARSFQQSYLAQLRQRFGELAFDTLIPDLAQFEQSVCARIPITRHAPRSRAAGIAREFFIEVEERIAKQERSRIGSCQEFIQPAITSAA